MFPQHQSIEHAFSLLETDALFRLRNEEDYNVWDQLARTLIKRLPKELVRFADAQGWIEKEDSNPWWKFPAFLACLIDNTESGIGNNVQIRVGDFQKTFGRGQLASLTELMRQLEFAWDHQIHILVNETPIRANKTHVFCVTFYAASVSLPTHNLLKPDHRVLH